MFWKVKTQSAKICLNFNLGEGGVLESQNPKCQDLPKFQFGEGGVLESLNPKCQDLPKFQLGVFWKVKTQSAKFCLNFNWGGGVLESLNPKCQDLPKFQMGGGFWKVKIQVPRSA